MKTEKIVDTEIVFNGKDKETFLNTLNKSGFLLEEKVSKIINNIAYNELKTNKTVEHKGERVETDIICKIKNMVFIIECKKTDHSWFFTRSLDKSSVINIISDSHEGVFVNHVVNPKDFDTSWSGIEIELNNGKIEVTNKQENIARSPRKKIHDHIRQVLKETEAYVDLERFIDSTLIPVIVTNAKLYFLDFENSNIDSNGDLTDFKSIKEVESIVYNFPEIMYWDKGRQMVKSKNSKESNHDHVKSVFIVNVNHLNELINILSCDLN